MSFPSKRGAHVWLPRGYVSALADAPGSEHEGDFSANTLGDLAVVSLRGPLLSHSNPWGFADYDSVFEAFVAARGARAIVLDLDSPGGVTSGMLECARACRDVATGIPIYAVANTYACSAAYAIACVADFIFAPASAVVGSIGVRSGLMSVSRANDQAGIDVRNIASGAQKLDGDIESPLSEEAIAREQLIVNELAGDFFSYVSARRRGLDARPLQGAALLGRAACEAGLTDGLATLGQVLGKLLVTKNEET